MNDYNSNKETGKALIPRLRFPEFQNNGEWEVKTIGDILNSQSSTLSLNKLKIKDKGYAVYGAEGIIGFIDNFQHNEQYISIVKDGSGVGRLNLCQAESSILGTLSALKVRYNNKHSLIYAYYLLNTLNFSIFVKGAGIPHIYYSDYKEARIGVPSLPEQQKIASCLSSIDEVIAGERQLLELLKAHKKGLLQNLFPQAGETVPKLRFQEFENSGKWNVLPLGSLSFEIKERTKGLKFKLLSISSGNGLISQIEKFGKEIAGKSYENYIVLNKGDFAYNKSSTKLYPEGEIAMLEKEEKGAVPSSIFLCFRFDNHKIYPFFAKYFFSNNRHGRWLKKFISIGARAHGALQINSKEFFSIPFTFPSIPEQQKIANSLSFLDDLIHAHQQKIELLEQHKKGLLQGLFPQGVDTEING